MRRSTWPCPRMTGSSTSPRWTAGTSSARGNGSGARWATRIPPTARCSRRSGARRRRRPGPPRRPRPRELQAVRRDGFATSIDELEVGLSAMAAPVRGARGEVLAALSISGPSLRMSAGRIAELQPILISEARRLSRRLGHREQGERAHDPEVSPWPLTKRSSSCSTTRRWSGTRRRFATASTRVSSRGSSPSGCFTTALIPSLEEVGARFERGDFFVPEMLIAARAMQGALDILRPLLAETGVAAGRHVPDGHGQGRRPRHRQEPVQHHARGRGLPRDRPGRQRARPRSSSSRSRSTTRTSSGSRPS